ncbi:hypothetical protein [Burkholderia sp. L27(2015)]|uniref:hypothetical protein n=1 Tax=Burkholderia sp. L27(2015) TaxID=1641858 RepID=UPI00131B6EA5|nr:hypothetical protein [Burkholderia sp. L27(2015)]
MSAKDYLSTFHGTSESIAHDLRDAKVDVTVGGGELGQGFYLGTALHVAKAWAKQRHDCETVVEFRFSEDHFWTFDIHTLDRAAAIEARSDIRAFERQRTFNFGKDMVWSPIVGGPLLYCDQHKWESAGGENFLNSSDVLRVKR